MSVERGPLVLDKTNNAEPPQTISSVWGEFLVDDIVRLVVNQKSLEPTPNGWYSEDQKKRNQETIDSIFDKWEIPEEERDEVSTFWLIQADEGTFELKFAGIKQSTFSYPNFEDLK